MTLFKTSGKTYENLTDADTRYVVLATLSSDKDSKEVDWAICLKTIKETGIWKSAGIIILIPVSTNAKTEAAKNEPTVRCSNLKLKNKGESDENELMEITNWKDYLEWSLGDPRHGNLDIFLSENSSVRFLNGAWKNTTVVIGTDTYTRMWESNASLKEDTRLIVLPAPESRIVDKDGKYPSYDFGFGVHSWDDSEKDCPYVYVDVKDKAIKTFQPPVNWKAKGRNEENLLVPKSKTAAAKWGAEAWTSIWPFSEMVNGKANDIANSFNWKLRIPSDTNNAWLFKEPGQLVFAYSRNYNMDDSSQLQNILEVNYVSIIQV